MKRRGRAESINKHNKSMKNSSKNLILLLYFCFETGVFNDKNRKLYRKMQFFLYQHIKKMSEDLKSRLQNTNTEPLQCPSY